MSLLSSCVYVVWRGRWVERGDGKVWPGREHSLCAT